ncbi:putative uncharacterized protein RUSC1-AS1 [Macaca mulatta]
MQIAIDWPLVSTAVFAGGVECNPPGMEPGGSENAAALWISEGGRGPGRGPGPEWTSGSLLPQSGPALLPTPYSHRKGPRETHPDALKGGGGWGWVDMQSLPGECRKGVGAGEEKDGAAVSSSTPHLLAASAGLQPAPSPLRTAVCPFSPHSSPSFSHHRTPSLFISPAPLSCPAPRALVHRPTPMGRALLTRVLLEPLRPWACPRLPRSPPGGAQSGRGGALAQPTLRSASAPLRAWAWRSSDPPPALSVLCHPPSGFDVSQAFGPDAKAPGSRFCAASPPSTPPRTFWKEPDSGCAEQEQNHKKVTQLFIESLLSPSLQSLGHFFRL